MANLLKNLITTLLLPVMYVQGKRVRKSVPELPEATGPEGTTGNQFSIEKKILLIGESTIAGVGVSTHKEGFAGELAESLSAKLLYRINWRVYARSGYTARRVAAKLIPKLEESEVELIIIGLGGNDTFTLNRNWSHDIKELINSLRNKYPSTPLLFINLPPVAEFPALPTILRFCLGHHMDKLRAELNKIVEDQPQIYFIHEKISLEAWANMYGLENNPELYYSDGIHPEKLTYTLWAKSVADYISKHKLL